MRKLTRGESVELENDEIKHVCYNLKSANKILQLTECKFFECLGC